MGDFVDSRYGKYNAFYNDNVPVLGLHTQEIGDLMWERTVYDTSGVSGIRCCGNTITVNTADGARIPVTGVDSGSDIESYAGQMICYLTIGGSGTHYIAGDDSATPAAPTNLTMTVSSDRTILILIWEATMQDTDGGALEALAYRVYHNTEWTSSTPSQPACAAFPASSPQKPSTAHLCSANTVSTCANACAPSPAAKIATSGRYSKHASPKKATQASYWSAAKIAPGSKYNHRQEPYNGADAAMIQIIYSGPGPRRIPTRAHTSYFNRGQPARDAGIRASGRPHGFKLPELELCPGCGLRDLPSDGYVWSSSQAQY